MLRAQTVQKLTFYYPDRRRRAVAGDHRRLLQGLPEGDRHRGRGGVCRRLQPDADQGDDRDQGRQRARSSPCCWPREMHSLQDQDILVSLDEIGLDADAKKWLDGFYPAFMANSHADGKTWSVPFQRSTAIFYYNKAAFRKPGSIPRNSPPPGRRWRGGGGEADQARCVRARDALGHQDGRRPRQRAVDVRRARQSGRAEADERGGHRGLFQPAEDDRGDGVLARAGRRSITRRRMACPTGRSCRRISCRATRRSSSTPPATCRMSATRRSSRSAWRDWPARTRRTPWLAAATCISSRAPARRNVQASAAVRSLGQRAGARGRLVDPAPATSPPARRRMTRRR